MKPLERHFWFGILLMLALLACTLTISWGIRAIHAPIGQTLQQAQEAVLTQDWMSARQAAQQADNEDKLNKLKSPGIRTSESEARP